jgi:predicted DNA-binding transcriptional regulator AlpA
MGYAQDLMARDTDAACFLRLPQILRLIPVGKTTIWQWVKDGKFPKQIKLGPKLAVWRKDEVDEFIEKQFHQNSKASAKETANDRS